MSNVMLDTKDTVVKKIHLVPGPERTSSQVRDTFFIVWFLLFVFFLITNNHIITIQINWRYNGEERDAHVAFTLRLKWFREGFSETKAGPQRVRKG